MKRPNGVIVDNNGNKSDNTGSSTCSSKSEQFATDALVNVPPPCKISGTEDYFHRQLEHTVGYRENEQINLDDQQAKAEHQDPENMSEARTSNLFGIPPFAINSGFRFPNESTAPTENAAIITVITDQSSSSRYADLAEELVTDDEMDIDLMTSRETLLGLVTTLESSIENMDIPCINRENEEVEMVELSSEKCLIGSTMSTLERFQVVESAESSTFQSSNSEPADCSASKTLTGELAESSTSKMQTCKAAYSSTSEEPTSEPFESSTSKIPTNEPFESSTSKIPTSEPSKNSTFKEPISKPTDCSTSKGLTNEPVEISTSKEPTTKCADSSTSQEPTGEPADSFTSTLQTSEPGEILPCQMFQPTDADNVDILRDLLNRIEHDDNTLDLQVSSSVNDKNVIISADPKPTGTDEEMDEQQTSGIKNALAIPESEVTKKDSQKERQEQKQMETIRLVELKAQILILEKELKREEAALIILQHIYTSQRIQYCPETSRTLQDGRLPLNSSMPTADDCAYTDFHCPCDSSGNRIMPTHSNSSQHEIIQGAYHIAESNRRHERIEFNEQHRSGAGYDKTPGTCLRQTNRRDRNNRFASSTTSQNPAEFVYSTSPSLHHSQAFHTADENPYVSSYPNNQHVVGVASQPQATPSPYQRPTSKDRQNLNRNITECCDLLSTTVRYPSSSTAVGIEQTAPFYGEHGQYKRYRSQGGNNSTNEGVMDIPSPKSSNNHHQRSSGYGAGYAHHSSSSKTNRLVPGSSQSNQSFIDRRLQLHSDLNESIKISVEDLLRTIRHFTELSLSAKGKTPTPNSNDKSCEFTPPFNVFMPNNSISFLPSNTNPEFTMLLGLEEVCHHIENRLALSKDENQLGIHNNAVNPLTEPTRNVVRITHNKVAIDSNSLGSNIQVAEDPPDIDMEFTDQMSAFTKPKKIINQCLVCKTYTSPYFFDVTEAIPSSSSKSTDNQSKPNEPFDCPLCCSSCLRRTRIDQLTSAQFQRYQQIFEDYKKSLRCYEKEEERAATVVVEKATTEDFHHSNRRTNATCRQPSEHQVSTTSRQNVTAHPSSRGSYCTTSYTMKPEDLHNCSRHSKTITAFGSPTLTTTTIAGHSHGSGMNSNGPTYDVCFPVMSPTIAPNDQHNIAAPQFTLPPQYSPAPINAEHLQRYPADWLRQVAYFQSRLGNGGNSNMLLGSHFSSCNPMNAVAAAAAIAAMTVTQQVPNPCSSDPISTFHHMPLSPSSAHVITTCGSSPSTLNSCHPVDLRNLSSATTAMTHPDASGDDIIIVSGSSHQDDDCCGAALNLTTRPPHTKTPPNSDRRIYGD